MRPQAKTITRALVQRCIALFGSACALAFAPTAAAKLGEPGTLDPTFGPINPPLQIIPSGKVLTSVGLHDLAEGMVLQPDGKIVIAGRCFNSAVNNYDFCALRYHANGTVDTTFGSGGSVMTPIGATQDDAHAVVLQADGKIVIAGYCDGTINEDFCALRYNADGSLDTSFGNNGVILRPMGSGSDYARAAALQVDGKILLAGNCSNGGAQFCIARFLSNGQIDTTFGTAGEAYVQIGVNSYGNAVGLQGDGKIVIAGSCQITTGLEICLARFRNDGQLDTSFGNGGTVLTSSSGLRDVASAVAILPNGMIVIAGSCEAAIDVYRFCAARYLSNGALDTTFGNAGIAAGAVGIPARSLALQADGKLLLAGHCVANSVKEFCVQRLLSEGRIDLSFGINTVARTSIGSANDEAKGIAVQPDGRVIVTGTCTNTGSASDFCAVRYDGGPFPCTYDLDGDGKVTTTIDVLIGMRIAQGMTGNAVIDGISFPALAARMTWPLIRDYLLTQCGMKL